VDVEAYLTGVEANDSVGMCSAIVQEICELLGCGYCVLCLGEG
jgi:hypothetical protein